MTILWYGAVYIGGGKIAYSFFTLVILWIMWYNKLKSEFYIPLINSIRYAENNHTFVNFDFVCCRKRETVILWEHY